MQELLAKELQEEQLLRDITGVQVMPTCAAYQAQSSQKFGL